LNREGGIRSIYKGTAATLMRGIFQAVLGIVRFWRCVLTLPGSVGLG